MKKKLMAVAVAGALAAPAMALAQDTAGAPPVVGKLVGTQIYGRLNLGFDNYQSEGATGGSAFDRKSRYRVFDFGSRLGFRGVEELGGGLRAVYLMESGVNVDSGNNLGQAGLANTSTGFLSSRIGHIGLSGNWGLLTFGRSNVWWGGGRNYQTGANYVSGNVAGPFSGTFGRGMSVGVTRVSNLIQYATPTFSGFNAVLSYSPNNQEAAGLGANADGKIWGLTVQGQAGQFIGGYDWVKNTSNSTAAAPSGTTTGNKLRAGWAYQPGAQVSLLWITSKLDNGGAAGAGSASPAGAGTGGVAAATTVAATGVALAADPSRSVKQAAWGLNWEHVFGNIQALAMWAKIRDATGCTLAANCANTNATQWFVGGRYLMSKRTAAYLTYGRTENAANYNVDYTGGSYTSGTAGLGADPRIWAFGVLHNF